MGGERKPTRVWNRRSETDGLELCVFGSQVHSSVLQSFAFLSRGLEKRAKKKKKGKTDSQTGKTDRNGYDVKGWSVVLVIFSLADKSIISSRSVHLHFPLHFHFLPWVLLFTKRCFCAWKEKAFLLPQTLQTWLVDDFVLCKISISALLMQHLKKKDTHQDKLWRMSTEDICISVSKFTKKN